MSHPDHASHIPWPALVLFLAACAYFSGVTLIAGAWPFSVAFALLAACAALVA